MQLVYVYSMKLLSAVTDRSWMTCGGSSRLWSSNSMTRYTLNTSLAYPLYAIRRVIIMTFMYIECVIYTRV